MLPLPDPQQVGLARDAIAEFERSRVPGVWPGLDRDRIVAGMRSRLDDPFRVRQGGQPFCGPAAIGFELIRRDPVRYVQICRNLFQIGGFHTRGDRWISASPRLRESRGNFQMPDVDWMLLSTLRESENIFLPVEPASPDLVRNLAGITKPWEIAGWTREILGYSDVKSNPAYLFGDINVLENTATVLNGGGVAFALINSDGLLEDKPPLVPHPNHWIVVLGDISISGSGDRHFVQFEVYSWAKKIRVAVDGRTFSAHFWEVITGK